MPRIGHAVITDALFRLAVSFAAGFGVVAAVTTLADSKGEGPAGFIGGLPLTGPVSLLAIGFTQSSAAAVEAVTAFPLGIASTISFLLFYSAPRGMRFWKRMALALMLWVLAASGFALWKPNDFTLSVAVGLGVSLAVIYARSRVRTPRYDRTPSIPGLRRTALRGLLGGMVVAAVVVIGEVGGPLAGGVVAAAPAVWSSSLYVTSRSQGVEFSRSLTWTFMKTGILTTVPYAVAAHYFFSTFPILLGAGLAYLAISPLAYLAWRLAGRSESGVRDPGGVPSVGA